MKVLKLMPKKSVVTELSFINKLRELVAKPQDAWIVRLKKAYGDTHETKI